jgi:signal transduction histidine kinase
MSLLADVRDGWGDWLTRDLRTRGSAVVAIRALLAVIGLAVLPPDAALPGARALLVAGTALCAVGAAVAMALRSPLARTGGWLLGDLALLALVMHVTAPFGVPVLLLVTGVLALAYLEDGKSRVMSTAFVIAGMIAHRLTEQTLIPGLRFNGSDDSTWDSVGTLIVAILGGLFVWSECDRQRHANHAGAVRRLFASLGTEGSIGETVAVALTELLRLSESRQVLLVLEHRGHGRMLMINGGEHPHTLDRVRTHRLPRALRGVYFPEKAGWQSRFRSFHACRTVSAFPFTFGEDWTGRLFMLDVPPAPRSVVVVDGLDEVLQSCVSAICATRNHSRIRRRAAARERAHLGRELHDGIVQELASLDLELEVLRRRATQAPAASLEVGLMEVQRRLRNELRELRSLQQRARHAAVDGSRLPLVLADIVERFRKETGIAAVFVPQAGEMDLPPRVCAEVVRIVQEALVNVRLHSGAARVAVGLTRDGASWKLSIQDDGRGLPASNGSWRYGLGGTVRAPAIIEERVHAIGGTLKLPQAGAGSGARLEIAVARRGPWAPRPQSHSS